MGGKPVSYDKDTGKGVTEGEWQNRRLDSEIAALGRPGMTAAELAPLLSEDLRSLYWRRKLDVYFAQELGVDAGDAS
jgi:hypothetical protein